MKRETVEFDREKLYEEVWTTPMSRLAPQYGLSDVGLAKVCKRLKVPRPPQGYWVKKQYGKKLPKRPPLPALAESEKAKKRMVKHVVKKETPPPDPQQEARARQLLAAEESNKNKITVPKTLQNPHKLVARTETRLRKAKPGTRGLVRPKGKGVLDVWVSPDSIDRTLRIMDALVKALEARGFSVSVDDNEKRSTRVTVLDETFAICMEEDYERQEKEKTPEQAAQDAVFRWRSSRPEYEYMPTGRLALLIKGTRVRGMRHRWGDGKKQRVENCLNKFVMGLINMAVAERAERLESERRHRQWEEEWRKERERQRRLEEEQRRIKALCSAATAHHEAQKIRAYVDAVREAVIEREGQIDPIGPMVCWLRWATRQADRLDPIAEHSPSALDESGETKLLEWEEETKTALKPYASMLGLRETDFSYRWKP